MALGLSSILRRFRKEESGGMTVEVVLWMPIFAALLCIVADASMIFGRKAEVLRIVQDANRAVSVGRFMDLNDAEAFITARINYISPNATVTTTVTEGVVRTIVTMPASDLTSDAPVGVLDSLTVSVTAEHLLEA